MKRYLILDGDHTTVSGTVRAQPTTLSFGGRQVAHEGDDVVCPACNSTGKIQCDGPRLAMPGPGGRQTALSNDLCICNCAPPPKLVATQQGMSIEV
ncbi:PAAR domain-containing protein [Paraburkholderia bannensis]|uniref:PAAR domain-containing protein n=1 Tax=Paraburkholderia bannensis TaxID=765414 RepID=UPI002AB763AB|nr:PAAR domain-containing protein [Paraburkholderia bannensis]